MNLQIINHVVELACLGLLVLCMLAPIKKTASGKRNPMLKKILAFHSFYAVALLVLALVHGILSGKKVAMFSGKLACSVLLILIILAIIQKRSSATWFKRVHVVTSWLLCVAIFGHVVHAIVT